MQLAIQGVKSYADIFQSEVERKTAEQRWEILKQKELNGVLDTYLSNICNPAHDSLTSCITYHTPV